MTDDKRKRDPIVNAGGDGYASEDLDVKRPRIEQVHNIDEIEIVHPPPPAEEDPHVDGPSNEIGGNDADIYQIELKNLPKQIVQKDIVKFLDENSIKFHKVKKPPVWKYAVVSFQSAEDRDAAINAIEGKSIKKIELNAVIVQPKLKGRQQGDQGSGRQLKNENDTRTPNERLADQVTPTWRKPYADQLSEKTAHMKKAMSVLRKNLNNYWRSKDATDRSRQSINWFLDAVRVHKNICPIGETVASPITEGYRTKCEFSIGINLEGEKTVGFLLGLYKDGITNVLSPSESIHVTTEAKAIARISEAFIRSSSLDVFDRVKHSGFWRGLLVRTHSTKENMVAVQVNPTNLSDDQIEMEVNAYGNYLQVELEKCNVSLTTLLFQKSDIQFNGFHEKAPLNIILGPGYVHEILLGIKFRISPTAFFQINTPATNKLYSTIRDWCNLDSGAADSQTNTVLLDMCCGTGTIGLTMANKVKKVIGVEIVEQAIEDAKNNAEINGISNVVYIAKSAETAMKEVFTHVEEGDNVVGILDPPRAGMHKSVIQAIRDCGKLKRIIYISCDVTQAMQNFNDLCRPVSNKFPGCPFRPVKALPLDLFPHTEHCELIVEFERVDLPESFFPVKEKKYIPEVPEDIQKLDEKSDE